MEPEPPEAVPSARVPDPIITQYASSCGACGQPVRWRVHEGSDNIEKRRRICTSVCGLSLCRIQLNN